MAMTNKDWYDSLDELERARVVVNFIRNNLPEHYNKFDEQRVRDDFSKWLYMEKEEE